MVIMSDCHRGVGNNEDNFLKNQNIFDAALEYYYRKGFTYIELGDGDEMWEVSNYREIVDEHLDTFKKLRKFKEKNRLYMVYGNHDRLKNKVDILEKYFYSYYDKKEKEEKPLLDGLVVYESLVLDYDGNDIFMLHGHQVDFFNNVMWRVSRFFVRHVWRILEKFTVKDPTSSAKNYQVTKKVEKRLEQWSRINNKIIIAGHTHRPIFPKLGQSLYFNDGCCIHPDGITALEINDGKITLVKWKFKVKKNRIYIGRSVIAGSEDIVNFFK